MPLPLLLLPEKNDPETDAVAAAWQARGNAVARLGKYWIKDAAIATQPIAIYGSQAFALVLAQVYEVQLISPDDTLVARLDKQWTKRAIQLSTISELGDADFPLFVKPVIPKMFMAGVYPSYAAFHSAVGELPASEELLVATVIDSIHAEVRCFVKEGQVLDAACYEGTASLAAAISFAEAFLQANKSVLPSVLVLDLACSGTGEWMVLEFNACWGAGLNGCDAGKVLDCIASATMNKQD